MPPETSNWVLISREPCYPATATPDRTPNQKYTLVKGLLDNRYEPGKALNLDKGDVAAVMISAAIQELIRTKGTAYSKDPLRYETDSVSAKGVFEIQRR